MAKKIEEQTREIKFRAWDKKHKRFLNHNDVETRVDIKTSHVNSTQKGAFTLFDDIDLIFTQFTGLKDKNDKEIYEGDIVKHTYRVWMDSGSCGQARYSNTGEVFYCVELGAFEIKRQGGGSPNFTLFVCDKMPDGSEPETNEVIGNIYENPELLKGG